MRHLRIILMLACAAGVLVAQEKADEGPTNEKAQKTYKEALEYMHDRRLDAALDAFRKADKQDGGHCLGCQRKMLKYGIELRDWKTAEAAAEEMVSEVQTPRELALAHYQFGIVLLNEGIDKHKEESFNRCHEEMTKALGAAANFPDAVLADARALAYLKQDDAAKARFEEFVKMQPADSPERQRVLRYIEDPELARARLAPPFAVTTVDGKRITLDDLAGKVVLIDFWATWCEPCRAALPRVREITKKFGGQPLVVLSVSVDTDEQKWKDFIAKNEMTWPQYLDRGFTGPVAKLFGVQAIPHTFTIDADGVLQDEHIGDASIEGKLRKLVRRAQETQAAQSR
jgi:peroxiredoxin